VTVLGRFGLRPGQEVRQHFVQGSKHLDVALLEKLKHQRTDFPITLGRNDTQAVAPVLNRHFTVDERDPVEAPTLVVLGPPAKPAGPTDECLARSRSDFALQVGALERLEVELPRPGELPGFEPGERAPALGRRRCDRQREERSPGAPRHLAMELYHRVPGHRVSAGQCHGEGQNSKLLEQHAGRSTVLPGIPGI
jgi:hypothetical protein